MDRLDLLGFLIITLNCNMTIVGKIWLILMILLRMGVIIVAGSAVYQDEQERFVCNTLQPGCANVCYDIFSPVSHLRFWLLQSASALLPSAVFSVYALHKGAALAARGACGPEAPSPADARGPPPCAGGRGRVVPDFSSGYIAHLCLRTLAETAFGALHYLLFGFSVPNRFSCAHSPCSGAVDCYVSRPTEKSALMLFLWALSALSVLLSVADLLCSLRTRTRGVLGPPEGPGGRKRAPSVPDWPGEEREALAHSGPWTGGHSVHSSCGQSVVSGRMGFPDEENEGLSLASDKLPRACTDPRGRPRAEAPQDSRNEHPGPERPGPPEHPGPERPGPERPGPPEHPGPERPGPEHPGPPEPPGPERPGPEHPGPPEPPGPEHPGPERPGPEHPGPERPGPEHPGPERPGPEHPGPPEPPGPERPGAPRRPPARHCPSSPSQLLTRRPGAQSAPVLVARRSEWV